MLVKMECPQCGATLEMDDKKEFMFCEFCGAKVANIAEKIELSGTVQIDESGKIDNFMTLADRAVAGGNYSEAYDYYRRILETDPDNIKAVFYKGLTAACLSVPEKVRIDEGIGAVITLNGKSDAQSRVLFGNAFTSDLWNFCDNTFSSYCSRSKKDVFPNAASARYYYEILNDLGIYLHTFTEFFSTEVMALDSSFEEKKKGTIEKALSVFSIALNSITYIVGQKNVTDKNGKTTQEDVKSKMDNPLLSDVKKRIADLKNSYNNLPTTVATIKKYDETIEANKEIIKNYEAALRDYFDENPETGKKYRHPGLFGRAKKRAEIEKSFPAELLSKKSECDKSRAAVETLVSERKAFCKANIK